jgi:hypothetical protein
VDVSIPTTEADRGEAAAVGHAGRARHPPERSDGHSRRDTSIDAIRGLCLVSMTVGHLVEVLGGRSVLWYLTHPFAWVDGATGFVFLSGVSLALADRSKVRRGWSQGQRRRWLLGRAAFLYGVHVAMTLAALALLGSSGAGSVGGLAPLDGETLLDVLSLGRVVDFLDILPLYAVFVTAAVGVLLHARSRRALAVVVVAATLVYAASQVWPHATAIHHADTGRISWVLGAWQLLFLAGVLAGRRWEAVSGVWDSRWRWAAGSWAVLSVVVLVLGRVQAVLDDLGRGSYLPAPTERFEEALLSKANLGPLRVALAVGAGLALHWLHRRLAGRWVRLQVELEELGCRSLRTYLSHVVLVLAVAVGIGTGRDVLVRELIVIGCLLGLLWLAHRPALGAGRPWSV